MNLKKTLKNTYSEILSHYYHSQHKKQAEVIIDRLSSKSDSATGELYKCDEYAEDIFGSKKYAPWLKVYTLIAGTFKEGWIPDNFYGEVVVPHMKGQYGKISVLKPLNQLLLNSPAFPDIGSYVNECFLDKDYNIVKEEDFKNILFKDNDQIIFKIDNSRQGLGVFIFNKENFDLDKIRTYGNGVFQSFITQHETLSSFSSQSVATLRITTSIDDDGNCTLRSAYLRLGTKGDKIVKSSSHLRIPIDIKTGAFSNTGYTAEWLEIDRHPDSHKTFAGHIFPQFNACLAKVTSLHKMIPFVRVVGWDVAVDTNNQIKIMEWNGEHNDIKFSEATQGPCFKDLNWENIAQ